MMRYVAVDGLKRHRLSALWPDHDPDTRDAVEVSVRRDGVVEPISLAPDGAVVDGWHRVLAARKVGFKTVPAVDVETDDLLRYSLARNAARRHVTKTQRCAIVLLALDDCGDDVPTQAEVAHMAGCSRTIVSNVEEVFRGGYGRALADGRMTLREAQDRMKPRRIASRSVASTTPAAAAPASTCPRCKHLEAQLEDCRRLKAELLTDRVELRRRLACVSAP